MKIVFFELLGKKYILPAPGNLQESDIGTSWFLEVIGTADNDWADAKKLAEYIQEQSKVQFKTVDLSDGAPLITLPGEES